MASFKSLSQKFANENGEPPHKNIKSSPRPLRPLTTNVRDRAKFLAEGEKEKEHLDDGKTALSKGFRPLTSSVLKRANSFAEGDKEATDDSKKSSKILWPLTSNVRDRANIFAEGVDKSREDRKRRASIASVNYDHEKLFGQGGDMPAEEVKNNPKQKWALTSTVKGRVNLWVKKTTEPEEEDTPNPFEGKTDCRKDGKWDGTARYISFANRGANYGRPLAGSKSERRGIKAGKHVCREMVLLCEHIYVHGLPMNTCIRGILFGTLFRMYNRISDKLVGILMRARRHGLVKFQGEMLYQGQDDDTIIQLVEIPRDMANQLGMDIGQMGEDTTEYNSAEPSVETPEQTVLNKNVNDEAKQTKSDASMDTSEIKPSVPEPRPLKHQGDKSETEQEKPVSGPPNPKTSKLTGGLESKLSKDASVSSQVKSLKRSVDTSESILQRNESGPSDSKTPKSGSNLTNDFSGSADVARASTPETLANKSEPVSYKPPVDTAVSAPLKTVPEVPESSSSSSSDESSDESSSEETDTKSKSGKPDMKASMPKENGLDVLELKSRTSIPAKLHPSQNIPGQPNKSVSQKPEVKQPVTVSDSSKAKERPSLVKSESESDSSDEESDSSTSSSDESDEETVKPQPPKSTEKTTDGKQTNIPCAPTSTPQKSPLDTPKTQLNNSPATVPVPEKSKLSKLPEVTQPTPPRQLQTVTGSSMVKSKPPEDHSESSSEESDSSESSSDESEAESRKTLPQPFLSTASKTPVRAPNLHALGVRPVKISDSPAPKPVSKPSEVSLSTSDMVSSKTAADKQNTEELKGIKPDLESPNKVSSGLSATKKMTFLDESGSTSEYSDSSESSSDESEPKKKKVPTATLR